MSLRLTVKKLYYQPDIGSSKPTLLTQYPRAQQMTTPEALPQSFVSREKTSGKFAPSNNPSDYSPNTSVKSKEPHVHDLPGHSTSNNLHQLLLATKTINLLTRIFSDRILEYPIVIFRTKHNMILAFIDRM